MAFEAIVGDEPVAATSNAGARLVTQQGTAFNSLSVELVFPNDAIVYSPVGDGGYVQYESDDDYGVPVIGGGFAGPGGFAGGGAGGGGFGGAAGGGGGGIGGLGGLMGIAGLAIGVTALANDDPGVGTPVAP